MSNLRFTVLTDDRSPYPSTTICVTTRRARLLIPFRDGIVFVYVSERPAVCETTFKKSEKVSKRHFHLSSAPGIVPKSEQRQEREIAVEGAHREFQRQYGVHTVVERIGILHAKLILVFIP